MSEGPGTMGGLPPASKSGFLLPLREACVKKTIPFIGIIRYVKEGVNVADGIAMASVCNAVLRLVPTADGKQRSSWMIPEFWKNLFEVNHRIVPSSMFG